jgi:hypothetical protein
MKVLKGLRDFPTAALQLDRRRLLRRAAVSVLAADKEPIAIECLGAIERAKALRFRPRLAPGTELTATSVRRDPFEIGIDDVEREVLLLSDGVATVADLAAMVGRDHDMQEAPVDRTIELLATMGRYDMLVVS